MRADGEVADIANFLRNKSTEPWLGFGVCAKLHEAADLLTRLSAAKAEAERERDEARAALRKHVVHQTVRLTHNGGVVPNGHYCGICRAECDHGEELVHETACILAALKLTPTAQGEP